MSAASGTALVGLVAFIVLRAVMTGVDVYATFQRGAEKGMRGAVALLPALSAMMLMLVILNASGLAQLLGRLAAPITDWLHLPQEAAPMLLLRPLTGSGSLAALEAVFENCGVDSRAGRIASVLMGSSETIFYTMAVYLGGAGVRKLPWVLPVSLTAYFFSAALCGWLM